MSDLHVHFHGDVAAGATLVIQVPPTGAIAAQLNQLKELITMSQADIAQGLQALNTQVQKIGAETTVTLQKVADLETVIAGMNDVSPELQAAFDAVKASVQTVDDLVPDAPSA